MNSLRIASRLCLGMRTADGFSAPVGGVPAPLRPMCHVCNSRYSPVTVGATKRLTRARMYAYARAGARRVSCACPRVFAPVARYALDAHLTHDMRHMHTYAPAHVARYALGVCVPCAYLLLICLVISFLDRAAFVLASTFPQRGKRSAAGRRTARGRTLGCIHTHAYTHEGACIMSG